MLSTHPGAGLQRKAVAASGGVPAKEGAGLVSCPWPVGSPQGAGAVKAVGKGLSWPWVSGKCACSLPSLLLALHLVLASDRHFGGPSELSRS